MVETIPTLEEDAPAAHYVSRAPQALELSVLTTLGTLRLAPAPPHSVSEPECEPSLAPLPTITTPDVPLAPGHQRRYISTRCYDVAFAVLILVSAAVALYRLVWMGQP